MSNVHTTDSAIPPRKSEGKSKGTSKGKGMALHGGVSFSTCVRTLTQITMSRRGLLNLEMAVGLAVFLDAGKADKAAKGMLAEIYSKAGYDCAKSDGKDYKTVNRRIGAASGLFGKLGLEVVNHWASERGEAKLLQALAHRLVELNFSSLDDVLDYAGRTSNRSSKSSAHAETSSGVGSGVGAVAALTPWDIAVGSPEKPVVVHIPRGLGEAELIELASKIIALAETLHEASQASQEGAGGADAVADAQVRERRLEVVAVPEDRRSA